MTAAKTKPTDSNVTAYLAERASPEQVQDCRVLMDLLHRVTGEQPKMWGPSIVGYGQYAYRYESGRTGESCATGFAIRAKELVIYLVAESPDQAEHLAKLGKHKMGKACLYIKRLSDLDLKVLESLVASSFAEVKRRYPAVGSA